MTTREIHGNIVFMEEKNHAGPCKHSHSRKITNRTTTTASSFKSWHAENTGSLYSTTEKNSFTAWDAKRTDYFYSATEKITSEHWTTKCPIRGCKCPIWNVKVSFISVCGHRIALIKKLWCWLELVLFWSWTCRIFKYNKRCIFWWNFQKFLKIYSWEN